MPEAWESLLAMVPSLPNYERNFSPNFAVAIANVGVGLI